MDQNNIYKNNVNNRCLCNFNGNFNDKCNCCQGLKKTTPKNIINSQGQPSISYRVGTYSEFMQSMLSSISSSSSPTILSKNLTSRLPTNDLIISLFDVWAIVCDVLSFYQERIANEIFLRTVTEIKSILELARTIGYELRPAVAASTFLSFTLEDTPGAISQTVIPIGTKVQSLPSQGQMPQIFETIESIVAKPQCNNLKLKLTKKQHVKESFENGTFYFKGLDPRIKNGDGLLAVINGNPNFMIAYNVNLDSQMQQTVIDVKKFDNVLSTVLSKGSIDPIKSSKYIPKNTSHLTNLGDLNSDNLLNLLKSINGSSSFNINQLNDLAMMNGWNDKEIFEILNSKEWKQKIESEENDSVFIFRLKAASFGNNAPKWSSLPTSQRYPEYYVKQTDPFDWGWTTPAYPLDWDKDWPFITTNSTGTSYAPTTTIFLDNNYQGILPESWVVIKNPSKYFTYNISETLDVSLVDFSLSGKATGLVLPEKAVDDLKDFKRRETLVYFQSENLELADIDIDKKESSMYDNIIIIDGYVSNEDLYANRLISISGQSIDKPEVFESEIATVSSILFNVDGNSTTIYLKETIKNSYNLKTVTINANVCRSTNGETKQEIIGSGIPSQTLQQFYLKQKPLTYLSASTPNGAKSTLDLTVSDIKWEEKPSLFDLGPLDYCYILRNNELSFTQIIFGDGYRGTRPSLDLENIKVKYRIGSGVGGNLDKGQLNLLMDRPLGVKSVTNPLPATGGTDSEDLNNARQNAPLTVLTIDRLVSLKDYEDFAKSFAGIGKAQAILIWENEIEKVHLTIASNAAQVIDKSSDIYKNLTKSINQFKDPVTQFKINSFILKLFNVQIKILVSDNMEFESVKPLVELSIKNNFSFISRQLGQPVTISEIMKIIQEVDGVVAADLIYLYLVDGNNPSMPKDNFLQSKSAYYDNAEKKVYPAELLIVNAENKDGIIISEMKLL